jgi:hypothetical protein
VREEEELFEREERLRKKQRGKGNQTWDFFERQRRESESIRGEEKNKDWWSQHREEEGPFLTHRCVSFPPPQQHRHSATIGAANASRTREGEEKQNKTERKKTRGGVEGGRRRTTTAA